MSFQIAFLPVQHFGQQAPILDSLRIASYQLLGHAPRHALPIALQVEPHQCLAATVQVTFLRYVQVGLTALEIIDVIRRIGSHQPVIDLTGFGIAPDGHFFL